MTYKYDLDEINQLAYGKWKAILSDLLELTHLQLSNKGQPCPMCGGKDRYCFTDKFHRGDYFCRGCGPGNGWTLIKTIRGCSFYEALNMVAEYLN